MKPKEIEDLVLDLLIQAYVNGVIDAGDDLGIFPSVDSDQMGNAVFHKVKDKNFVDRVYKYADENDIESIIRVADTDMQRVYNTGVYDTGKVEGAQFKQWITMSDDKVRDTHTYLEGVQVGIDDEFYTFDGDHALYPGGFEDASNNVNCRCVIKLLNEKE